MTNVGATKINPGRTVNDPESAVVDPAGHPYKFAFSSGGGFSNIYPQPDYQKAAVANYFQNYNPPYLYYTGLFPLNFTGFPDTNIGQNGGIYNRMGRG